MIEPSWPNPDEAIEVSVRFLESLREREEAFVLLDCRDPEEHAFCRIAGSQLIPLSTLAEQIGGLEAEKGEPMVVYCHHGVRSLHATQYLRAEGYSNAFSLTGGIDAWSCEVDHSVPRY